MSGTLDTANTAKLEQWLDVAGTDGVFEALPEEEKEIARKEGYQRLQARIRESRRSALVKSMLRNWKAAACIACLVVAGVLERNFLLDLAAPHRLVSWHTPAGKTKKQILSDGSIVWLKGNSTLIYPAAFGVGSREVILEGEALFEIAQEEARPFLVKCGHLTTTVLGTSFNIRHTNTETQVVVLTGKIALSTPQRPRLILYPDQQAVYTPGTAALTPQKREDTSMSEIMKDTEYNMSFNDAAMQTVIGRIEKKFDVDIQLQDTEINNNLITADLTGQSLQYTMEMICQVLNLDFEIKGKTILLTQKK
ncbi:FecR family protein [Chitinophaga sp. 30R24]|uniref:FecR family protein n=1 Tax=Chitinophaga sp. 30R24 TaxID=3248838 RepID=UPI003B9828EC